MKKIDKYVERPESVLTGKKNLELLHSLKDFPVFFGCVDTPSSEDLVADMNWAIDPETGVVQLTRLIPLEILYKEQHVDGCGPTWQNYYTDFANYIVKQNPKSVLEIGGGSGQIAQRAVAKDTNLKWLIVEPNPTFENTDQISTISAFFDNEIKVAREIDTVTFSQVWEHAYDPRDFLANIATFLKPGGKLIFAYPDLELWLSRKFTNAINFEHTMLFTEAHIDSLLPEYGFKTIDKEYYNEHSYLYTIEKTDKELEVPEMPNKYKEYKKIFLEFIKYHEDEVQTLNAKIDASTEPVYLFGAHIFSTYLIAFGLDTSNIVQILDNSPTKKGKRLYGTEMMVDQPQMLKSAGKVNVIIRAGIYNEEIKKDIIENINPDVTFW